MDKRNHKPKLILQSALIVLLASLAQNGQTVLADSESPVKAGTEVTKQSPEKEVTKLDQENETLEKASPVAKSEEIPKESSPISPETWQADTDTLPSISLIDQAKAIHEGKYKVETSEKLDGRGVVIASVDSGIDPDHEALKLDDDVIKNHLKIAKDNNGISDKIPYVFDFMSGDDSIKDPQTEHGMHIAGVLVGNSKKGFKGLAPNAQLLAYRTWSKDNSEGYQESNQFIAMEDAIKRGADVISLSIGELGTGRKDDLWAEVIRNARKKNVIIAASMANYGTSSMTNSFDRLVDEKFPQTDTSTTLSVSSNPYVIGVGSYYDTHTYLPHLHIGGLDLAYENINWNNYYLFDQEHVEEKSFEHAIIDYDETPNVSDLSGKVVLVRRTADYFFPQVDQLVRKNAKGVILINAPGTYTYGNYQSLPEVRSTLLVDKEGLFKNVWAISLSENDGQKLKDYLKKHPKPSQKLDFKTKPILTKVFDHPGISGFSTWGTSPSLELKPDLVAPGENVYSTGNDNSYFNDSGTSMAAPHAAGASALLLPLTKDYQKAWNKSFKAIELAQLNKLLLQNTANVLKDYTVPNGKPILAYSPRRQGAGAIDLEKALKTKVFISAEDNKGVLNLKDFTDKEKHFNIVIRNLSDKSQQFEIDPGTVLGKISYDNTRKHYDKTLNIKSVHSRAIDGANLQLASHISIAPHSEMIIPVKLNVGQAQLHEFVEGFIKFKALSKEQADLSIPYLGFYGDWNNEKIVDPVSWQEGSKTKMTGIVRGYPLGEDKFDFVPWGVDYDKWKADNDYLESDPKHYVMQTKRGVASHAKMKLRLMFMRHAKDYKVEIVDTNKNKSVKVLKTGHYYPKYMESAFREYPDRYGLMFGEYDPDLEWDGSVYDSITNKKHFVDEGDYFIKVKARLDETRAWQEMYIPFKVDNTKPDLILTHKTTSEYTFDIKDKHLKDVALYKNRTEIKKLVADQDGLYRLDISSFDKGGLELRAIDYADNYIIYDFAKESTVSSEESLFGPQDISKKSLKRLANNNGFELYSEDPDDDIDDWDEEDEDDDTSVEAVNAIQDGDAKEDSKEETSDADDQEDDDDALDDKNEDSKTFENGADIHDDKFTLGYVEGNRSSDLGSEDDESGQRYRTYYIHLKEGQRLLVTNTNALYNNQHQKDFTDVTYQTSIAYKPELFEQEHYYKIDIPIYQGSNIINVKTYYNNELIFNKGYAVKLDTEAPRLSFKNRNIAFKGDDWVDSEDYEDEVVGVITIPTDQLQLKGTIRDALDGWKLFINDDMIDSTLKLGEYDDYFHQNQKDWFYEKTVVDGEYVKIEVWDHLKNTKTYLFQVKIDPSARGASFDSDESHLAAEEELAPYLLKNDLQADEQFKDFDMSQMQSAENAIQALANYAPGYSIQMLKFKHNEMMLRLEKDGKYQLMTLKAKVTTASQSEKMIVDKALIHQEKDWASNTSVSPSNQFTKGNALASQLATGKSGNSQKELPMAGEFSQLKYMLLSFLSISAAWLLPSRKKIEK